MESGYYPPGAEHDPNAPYNQPGDPPELEVKVECYQALVKTTTCWITDYCPGYNDYDGYEPDDLSNVNWTEDYKMEHKTPLELINILKEMCSVELLELGQLPAKPGESSREIRNRSKYLNYIIQECEGWAEDDFNCSEG